MKKTLVALTVASALLGLSGAADAALFGTLKIDGVKQATPTFTVGETTTIGQDGQTVDAYVVWLYANEHLNILGETINIGSEYPNAAFQMYEQGKGNEAKHAYLTVGNENTQTITLTSGATWGTLNFGNVTLNAKNVIGDFSKATEGFHVGNQSQYEAAPEGTASLSIRADNIQVTAIKDAIAAFSNGLVDMQGNVELTATNVIQARGYATVNINTEEASAAYTTKLNGNIIFATPNQEGGDSYNSGNLIDAYVTVSLSGADSYWNGRSYQSFSYVTKDEEGKEVTIPVITSVIGENRDYFGQVKGLTVKLNGLFVHECG
jgi:hypothetical protein